MSCHGSTPLFQLLFAFAAFLLTISIGSSAFAQDEPTFEDLITDAKTAFDSEEYQEAVDLLLYAHRVQPNARLLINVAKSYEKLDECANALVYYKAYLREDETEKGLVKTAEIALRDADDCDAYTESMSGRLIIKSTPLDATIAIDGARVGTTPFEVPGLEAGDHAVVITLEGFEPFETTVNLKPDTDETVSATLTEAKVEPVVATPAPTTDPDPTIRVEKKSGPDPMLYVAGGITAVGLGLLGFGLYQDLSVIPGIDEDRDATTFGSPRYDALTADRESAANAALIGYIGGALLTVGGGAWLAYILFLSEPADAPTPTVQLGNGVDLRPVVRHDGGGLILEGSF